MPEMLPHPADIKQHQTPTSGPIQSAELTHNGQLIARVIPPQTFPGENLPIDFRKDMPNWLHLMITVRDLDRLSASDRCPHMAQANSNGETKCMSGMCYVVSYSALGSYAPAGREKIAAKKLVFQQGCPVFDTMGEKFDLGPGRTLYVLEEVGGQASGPLRVRNR